MLIFTKIVSWALKSDIYHVKIVKQDDFYAIDEKFP